MNGEPRIMETRGDMLVGITPDRRIEIAYDDDGIRAGVYLRTHHPRLFIAQRDGTLPFGFETFERREDTFIVTLLLRLSDIFGREIIRLKVIIDQAEGIGANDHITTVGEVAPRLIMNALLMDKRVLGPDHRAVLMAAVINREIEIGVRIFGAERLLHFGQSEIARILIDIDLLQADDIRILGTEIVEHLVLRGLLKLPHPTRIPGEDSDGYEDK